MDFFYGRPLPALPAGQNLSSNENRTTEEFDPYAAFDAEATPSREPHSEPQISRFLAGSTMLHDGFYQILSIIPTPSSPRLLWGPWNQSSSIIPGPRYEDIAPSKPPYLVPGGIEPPSSFATPSTKYRQVRKETISPPTDFVHLVHASDAEQYEELLRRWGPDGMGKLPDPHWARPIIDRMRQKNQAIAVNDVVNAHNEIATNIYGGTPPLHVVNGMSVMTSSILTTAAQEDLRLAQAEGLPSILPGGPTMHLDRGVPSPSKPQPRLQHRHQATFLDHPDITNSIKSSKSIVPSLHTMEKAVAARIYFENMYFPILRHTPSREQRRLAMEQDMMGMRLSEAQKDYLRARWRQNESDYLRERRRKIDVTSFVKLKTIGHGAFGVVSLVKERPTGRLFAMKELRKTDMLRKGQEGHVRAERDVLKSASSVSSAGGAEWIVRMHYSFQDRDHLYLILEFMSGGDLLNLLIERDTFDEDFTRFYVAEMVLAVEACHKLGFIHRDIKPDNFLFSPEGHLKLSDFGLATDLHWAHDTSYYDQQRKQLLHKHGIDLQDSLGIADGRKTKRMSRKEIDLIMGGGGNGNGLFTWREKHSKKLAYSVCGTNSYMSPEVIRGHGYTFSCDWWSLGIILFECLYGYPPFVSNSRQITRQKILNHKQALRFPSRPRVSHEAINLMEQLICEPEDRLGSQSTASVSRPNSIIVNARRSAFLPHLGAARSVDGAEHIKAHQWFQGIDWLNIHRYPAPYKPELHSPGDTRHFDDDIPAEPLAAANGAPADATKDPLLSDKVHGPEILNVRKALAFAGFTHKSPRVISYVEAENVFVTQPEAHGRLESMRVRGRSTILGAPSVGRALSL